LVESGLLGQVNEPAESCERLGVGSVGAVQELAEREVDPDDVGPEGLPVPEVAGDRGPVGFPEVLDQPAGVSSQSKPSQSLARFMTWKAE
jgi:hypothetical protein